jgi:predicted ATP-grasp superfamily ATP-dependent carboligase
MFTVGTVDGRTEKKARDIEEMKSNSHDGHNFDDHLGSCNEHRAIVEFLSQGCEVFKNVRQHGPIDIIVIHPDGKEERLDVKTRAYRKRDKLPIHRSLTEKQKKLDVRIYYIDANYEGHRHPPKGVK